MMLILIFYVTFVLIFLHSVFFRRREAEVYPDDYPNKPEVGQELNKPSEITIFKVWPNDKSSHTPVKVSSFLPIQFYNPSRTDFLEGPFGGLLETPPCFCID